MKAAVRPEAGATGDRWSGPPGLAPPYFDGYSRSVELPPPAPLPAFLAPHDTMPLAEKIAEVAAELAEGVAHDWNAEAAKSPHLEIPKPVDANRLADLIVLLTKAAEERRSGDYGPDFREMIRAAIRHGRDRRDDGFSEDLLLAEYHLLRRAVWEHLKSISPLGAAETILRIDAEITVATSASLHGFQAVEEEEEDLVEGIATRWSF